MSSIRENNLFNKYPNERLSLLGGGRSLLPPMGPTPEITDTAAVVRDGRMNCFPESRFSPLGIS